ncbi:transient receptor potential ion channel [Ophiostoma piceae UAMH 11346]|uniref:Transient receptor potential ion channel n=1 Tax=Ophiostoma piceae (strain UAMH 11346) TaxID=1262450 RepID=S3CEN2_OPHP1|nr:transient receptor potential ion channel [Ophiostoma piceae UAMH 11346]
MMLDRRPLGLCKALAATALASLVTGVAADNILQTSSFSNCGNNSDITVQKVDIQYNSNNQTVTFDVAGSSSKLQNVTAILNVTAYGIQVYSNAFNPCDAGTFVSQLCPVPVGSFSARGVQAIPAQFADAVPSIAYQIPDIAAQATLQLIATDDAGSAANNTQVACIQSQVTNGKTTDVPAVSYVAAGVAGAALVLGGVSAVGAALASGGGGAVAGGSSAAGMGTISPSFGEVLGWFQGMAMNSMLSVNYPQVYRSFAKNFGFSTGLIPWTDLQIAIDNFRVATGGNLTNDSVQFLQNATLVFPDGSTDAPSSASSLKLRLARSALALGNIKDRRVHKLLLRAIETTVNGTDTATGSSTTDSVVDSNAANTVRVAVSGIQAYVEELSIPSASTFMTVLLIVAIIIASITVGLLLVKVILEAWALIGRFPESLAEFRKHYWRSIARAITTLILLLYGVWVLYCMFQFTQGDSWAAKALAGVTLGLFTAVLAFFSFKIWYTAQKLKHEEGDTSGLYDDQNIWSKYSLFYESYRKQYWWVFVPAILYMFAKGVALAVGDGHGMAQTIAQLTIESLMLILLAWSRPYERRSSNVVNIVIQVVRVLSVICILIFVEEFGIAETTQTVAGVVLIAVQSALSGILALLIAWNAIAACIKKNPHEQRRKEMLEKARADDNLTPLDARNSLLRGKSPLPDEEAPANDMAGFQFAAGSEKAASKMMPVGVTTTITAGRDAPAATSANLAVPRMPPSRQASSVAYSTLSASSGAVMIGLATGGPDNRSLTPQPSGLRWQNKSVDDGNSLLGNVAPMGEAEPTLPNVGPGLAMANNGVARRDVAV